MTAGVYAITNTTNDRVYVGSSGNVHERWQAHLSRFRNGKQHPVIQGDWDRYGADSFVLTVLEEIDDPTSSVLELAERRWLEHFVSGTTEVPYNMRPVVRVKKVRAPCQNRVRELRKSQQLTITQVAAATGLTRQTIYNIESAEPHRPSVDVMSRVAKALDVTVDDLLSDEDAA